MAHATITLSKIDNANFNESMVDLQLIRCKQSFVIMEEKQQKVKSAWNKYRLFWGIAQTANL